MKRYLLLFAVFIILALALNEKNHWYILPAVLFMILIINRQSFLIFLKWKFIILLLFLLLGIPLVLGNKDAQLGGISYSTEYLRLSGIMVSRSIIILLSIKMITGKISLSQISKGLQRIHLHQFSQVFSIAMHVLPEIQSISRNTLKEFKFRDSHGNIFSRVYHLLITLVVKILLFADQYHLEQNKPGETK